MTLKNFTIPKLFLYSNFLVNKKTIPGGTGGACSSVAHSHDEANAPSKPSAVPEMPEVLHDPPNVQWDRLEGNDPLPEDANNSGAHYNLENDGYYSSGAYNNLEDDCYGSGSYNRASNNGDRQPQGSQSKQAQVHFDLPADRAGDGRHGTPHSKRRRHGDKKKEPEMTEQAANALRILKEHEARKFKQEQR